MSAFIYFFVFSLLRGGRNCPDEGQYSLLRAGWGTILKPFFFFLVFPWLPIGMVTDEGQLSLPQLECQLCISFFYDF